MAEMILRKLIEDFKQRAIEVGVHSDPGRPEATAEVQAALADAEAALYAHIAPAAMTNRFLRWQLPQTFGPDCYITFDREKAKVNQSWPVGTNLLSADEARAMFEHALGVPASPKWCPECRSAGVVGIEQDVCPTCDGLGTVAAGVKGKTE